jgi:hypothetical protein
MCEAQGVERTACVISDPRSAVEACPIDATAPEDQSGTLCRTASPTALPLNTIRPRLTRSGRTLTCKRGNWRNASRFAYTWRVNGTVKKSARKPRLPVGKARKHSVSCSVTASNAAGTTTASSAQIHVR